MKQEINYHLEPGESIELNGEIIAFNCGIAPIELSGPLNAKIIQKSLKKSEDEIKKQLEHHRDEIQKLNDILFMRQLNNHELHHLEVTFVMRTNTTNDGFISMGNRNFYKWTDLKIFLNQFFEAEQ